MLWFLMLIVAVALLLLSCACVCGCLAHAVWYRRDKVTAFPKPASSTTRQGAATTGSSAKPEAKIDQLTQLLEFYTVPVLREACRARGLPVGGLKADIIRRLAAAAGLPTPSQIETMRRTMTTLATRGLSYPLLLLEDVMVKERARAWLCGSAGVLSRRP